MGEMIVDGRIVKGIAGFYYVNTGLNGLYECHAKGILRRGAYRPLVGDYVSVEILDEEKKLGNLIDIKQRTNSLIRPEVANIDKTVIVFAYEMPEPNLLLLDRFIIMLEKQGVEPVICFNKLDIADEEQKSRIVAAYVNCGYRVLEVSAINNEGMDELKKLLAGRTTALAGPSGVGKSSLINRLCPGALMETGDISRKTSRGKHTTRHSEIFEIDAATFIVDTPGFTSLELLEGMQENEIKAYYKDFYEYEGQCRFDACSHTHEPGCAVKEAVDKGTINKVRYDNYVTLYNELKNKKKY